MAKLQTVFYVIQTGVAIRNILRTDAFEKVKTLPDTRIVILSGMYQDHNFRKEFGGKNVFFEPLYSNQNMSFPARLVLQTLGLIQATRNPSKSYDIRIDLYARQHPSFKFWYTLTKPLLKKAWFERFVKKVDMKLFGDARYDAIMRKYEPDLIFFAGSLDYDAFPLMRRVMQKKIPSITFITSWDNLTKGAMIIRSEDIVVWNDIMKQEAIQYHGYDKENVHKVGALPFDHYHKHKILSRNNFCKQVGLDPNKRIIMFASVTKHLVEDETYVLRDLSRVAKELNAQVLARIYARRNIEEFEEFNSDPFVVLDQPKINNQLSDRWNPDKKMMAHLANSLHHADVLVANSTTLLLEATIFDTPIIGYSYDEESDTPYIESCRRFWDYTHFARIVDSGAIRLADSPDELRRLISTYLDDPGIDHESREQIRKSHIGNIDGKAGTRIADLIISRL